MHSWALPMSQIWTVLSHDEAKRPSAVGWNKTFWTTLASLGRVATGVDKLSVRPPSGMSHSLIYAETAR